MEKIWMTYDNLRRIMQLVRSRYGMQVKYIRRDDLEKITMRLCGTSTATFYNNVRPLVKLGWIARRKKRFLITGKDLEDDDDY